MADNDLEVKFGADISGLQTGATQAGAAVQGVEAPVAALAEEMAALQKETLAEAATLKELAASVKEGVASFNEAKEAVMSFGEAMLAAFAVEQVVDWAKDVAEAGEHTAQLGAKLGVSTAEMQGWQSVATLTGRSVDQFAGAMTRASRSAVMAASGSKMQAAAFKDLGVSAQDAVNPQKMMLEIADRMAAMHEAGQTTREIADAMAIMGRSGADMIPILNEGAAGIQAMMAKGADFGAVMDAAMNEKVDQAAEKINEFKLRMDGLSKQTFVQLIPQIEAFVQWMSEAVGAIERAVQPGSEFRNALDEIRIAAIALGAALTAYLGASLTGAAIKAVLASEALQAFAARMAFAGTVAEVAGSIGGLEVALGVVTEALGAAAMGAVEFTAALLANPVVDVAVAVGALAFAFEQLAEKTRDEKAAAEELKGAQDGLTNVMAGLSTMTKEQAVNAEMLTRMNIGLARSHLEVAVAADQRAMAEAHLIDGLTGQMFPAVAAFIAGTKNTKQAADDERDAIDKLQQQMKALDGWKPPEAQTIGTPKAGKGESQSGKWTEELHDKELKAAADTGDFMKDQTAMELAFWQQKLALTTEGSRSWFEVQDKIFGLMKASQTQAYNSLIAGDKEKIAEDANNHAMWAADWTKYLGDIAQAYGKDSSEYKTALAEKAKAEAEFDKKIVEARIKAIGEQTKAAAKGVQDELAATKAEAQEKIAAVKEASDGSMGARMREASQTATILAQELAAEEAAALKEYQLAVASADQIAALKPRDAASDMQLQMTKLGLWTNYYAKIGQLSAQSAKQQLQNETAAIKQMQSAINPMVSSFTTGMMQMAEGTKSLAQVVRNMGQQMLQAVLQSIDRQISFWIAGELVKKTATIASNEAQVASTASAAAQTRTINAVTNLKEITQNAAAAAAAAYKALAGIPIIGPGLGAAAAAVTFAAVESFGAMASAEGGYDIPSGVAPITQLHPEEMVLPARIANPLRLALGSSGAGAALGASGGGNTTHNWNIQAMDSQSFTQMLQRNPGALVDAVRRQVGKGAMLGTSR